METEKSLPVAQERYRRHSVLASQGAITTWLGSDCTSDLPVVLKVLRLSTLNTWKQLERFEREVAVLKHLQHRGLPRCLDTFQLEDRDGPAYCLVLEKLPGTSLEARLEAGWQPQLDQVLDLAEQILQILQFLHQHAPPVVHRDLKPSNILRDDEGRVWLIDFGSVQLLLEPEGGSTVVGSFGYMPPEQFCGQGVPASDLYGLGATLVHLLAGIPPAEMIFTGTRLRFEPYLQVPVPVREWLASLLAPLGQRWPDATQALTALAGLRKHLAREQTLMRLQQPQPALSRLELETSEKGFSCHEPQRFSPAVAKGLMLGLLLFDAVSLSLMGLLLPGNTWAPILLLYASLALLGLHLLLLPQFRLRSLCLDGDRLQAHNDWRIFTQSSSLRLEQIRTVRAESAFGGWRLMIEAQGSRVLLGGLTRTEAESMEQLLLQQALKVTRHG